MKNIFQKTLNFFIGTIVNFTFDNKGGNDVLGFAGGFSATYFCRTCTSTKNETQSLTIDIPNKHRTQTQYNDAIKLIAESSDVDLKKTLGIKVFCPLNKLSHFNILDNLNADIMHDICEGTVRYLLLPFFKHLITKKVIRLDRLKQLIAYHDYGILNRQNVPSDLSLDTSTLNQNASQAKCIVQHLPFIFSEYRDNLDLKNVWICVESMLEIMKICYSNTITERNLVELNKAVDCHLSNMITKFKITLKPKHHFMTHYAHIIRSVGPLVHMSTMRYETKHKEFTQIAKTTNNFRNINETLAKRHQQRHFFDEKYKCQVEHAKFRTISPSMKEKYKSIMSIFPNTSKISITRWLKINSDLYQSKVVIQHNKQMFEIQHVLRCEQDFFFICTEYNIVKLDKYFNSIQIKNCIPDKIHLIRLSDIHFKKTHDIKHVGDETFVIIDSLDVENIMYAH